MRLIQLFFFHLSLSAAYHTGTAVSPVEVSSMIWESAHLKCSDGEVRG